MSTVAHRATRSLSIGRPLMAIMHALSFGAVQGDGDRSYVGHSLPVGSDSQTDMDVLENHSKFGNRRLKNPIEKKKLPRTDEFWPHAGYIQ